MISGNSLMRYYYNFRFTGGFSSTTRTIKRFLFFFFNTKQKLFEYCTSFEYRRNNHDTTIVHCNNIYVYVIENNITNILKLT